MTRIIYMHATMFVYIAMFMLSIFISTIVYVLCRLFAILLCSIYMVLLYGLYVPNWAFAASHVNLSGYASDTQAVS